MELKTLLTIGNITAFLGLIGAIWSIFNIFSKLTKLYSDLVYRDQEFSNQLKNLSDEIKQCYEFQREYNSEHRNDRARIWDRLATIENQLK